MFDTKGSARDVLCEYDLDINLFKIFDLHVYDVFPVRKAFILSTDKGNKILKKINYPVEELNFINNALEYVNRSFNRTIGYVKTKDNKAYTLWENNVYFVMDLLEGRESEYSNPVDLKIATESLAEFHNAGEGIVSYVNYESRNNCGKLIESLKRRKEEMKFFKNIANWYEDKSDFDFDFLKNVDYNIEMAQRSIDELEKSKYYKLCSEEDKVVLCHHDLAHHNLIINRNKAYLIDFDYCMIDLKVHDLCNFITKAIKNFAYDVDRARAILDDYEKINPLDKRELQVLYAMLLFPEDFYSISKDYYTKRKSWTLDTFLNRLEKKLDFREEKEEFLIKFKEKI
ncbi:CotS family spore coat protein [Haloimpatiens sp. FM7315]|uniref:CotS family spore coat protein n=1 Tax=Haloimpatiens sp. FM7315 TaxID=3298609 RepID=UPI0035A2966A